MVFEAQRSRLLTYISENTSRNYRTKPEWIYEDVHTGSDMNRPQLQKLLAELKKGTFDAVLVWKIDRLSRSLKHLLGIFEQLEQHQVSFVSLQENIDFVGPIGKLIFQIFGAIAQFERELIKGRTRMGKITSAEMGNYTGTNIPYGYKPVPNPSGKGKKLRIIPAEKKWVEQMYHWHIYEHMGYQKITNRLNELKAPKGKYAHKRSASSPWSTRIVEDILTSPIYRGEFIANKKDEQGKLLPPEKWTIVKIPPCVSEFTFQQGIEARRLHHNGPQSMEYLLSGKLVDMTLDRPKRFSGVKRTKGGISYRRLQFTDRKGTYHPSFEIPGKQLEEYAWEKILEALQDPEIFIKTYLAKQYADPNQTEQMTDQLTNLREKQTHIRAVEIPRIEAAYERGVYDEDKLQEKLTAKEQECVEIEQKIVEIEDQLALMGNRSQEIKQLNEASAQVKYRLDRLTRPQRKILCQLFVDRIEMTRTKPKGHYRWDVNAEIHFRFNPNKFPTEITEGRTDKSREEAVSGDFVEKNGVPGQKSGSAYTLFTFRINFKSDRSKVILKEVS